jgi:hypothetical protein
VADVTPSTPTAKITKTDCSKDDANKARTLQTLDDSTTKTPASAADCGADSSNNCCYVETTDSLKVCKSVKDANKSLKKEQEDYITKNYANVKTASCPATKITANDCNLDAFKGSKKNPTASTDCGSDSSSNCCMVTINGSTATQYCKSVPADQKNQKTQQDYLTANYDVKNALCPADKKILEALKASTCQTTVKPTSYSDCAKASSEKCCYVKTNDTVAQNFCVKTFSAKKASQISEIKGNFTNYQTVDCAPDVSAFPDSNCATSKLKGSSPSKETCNSASDSKSSCCYAENSDSTKKSCILGTADKTKAKSDITTKYGLNVKASSIECSARYIVPTIVALIASLFILL